MEHADATEWWVAAFGPLCKAGIDFTIGVEQTQRLAPAWKKLLEKDGASKTCQFLDGIVGFFRSRDELAGNSDSSSFTLRPRFYGLDDGWQANFIKCRCHFAYGADRDATRNSQAEFFGNLQRLLFVDGYF